MTDIDYRWRNVKDFGQPIEDECPYGFRWEHDGLKYASDRAEVGWNNGKLFQKLPSNARWAPLHAPPTEEAPAPEPVARWTGMFGESCGFIAYDEDTLIPLDVVDRACDALNTLDANGVAWGPGRPMQELPDGHEEYVLVAYTGDSGAPWSVAQGTTRANDVSSERLGWWPLPEVTP